MSQTAGNYPAPLRILDVVKSGLNTSDGSGYDRESRVSFKDCVCSLPTIAQHSFSLVLYSLIMERHGSSAY